MKKISVSRRTRVTRGIGRGICPLSRIYWDGTRKSYERGPDWLFGWSRWRNGGILVLEGRSAVILASKPTWIVREIDGRGVYPIANEIFTQAYTPVSD